jgi:hypothetical protein
MLSDCTGVCIMCCLMSFSSVGEYVDKLGATRASNCSSSVYAGAAICQSTPGTHVTLWRKTRFSLLSLLQRTCPFLREAITPVLAVPMESVPLRNSMFQ